MFDNEHPVQINKTIMCALFESIDWCESINIESSVQIPVYTMARRHNSVFVLCVLGIKNI